MLETTESIYKHLNISEMKVINMNGANGGNGQDTAGQLIGQIFASCKTLGNEIEDKRQQ